MRSALATGDYYMLMASLPAMPKRFDTGPAPITLQRLRNRWTLVSEQDREILERIANSQYWDRQPLNRTDEDIYRAYESLMGDVRNPVVREVISFRMDVRIVVSALRRRQLGLGPPPKVGHWAESIRRNWTRPDFGLGGHLRWLLPIARLLESGDTLETERAILNVVWDKWTELSERVNYFSFESLTIYLSKRDAVMRWANLDVERGKTRFDQLMTESLGEYADLFGPGSSDRG